MKYVISSSKHRSDIDGLRALAILSVLLFHIDDGFLQGGFVGVDVFFVISGYLITGLIYKEFVNNNFINYKRFYYRRMRRLLPALLTTLVLTYIGSVVFLIPPYNMYAIKSNIYALFGISNIDFWIESGYFDHSKYFKPLLHTWSLGVEEQFYLLWPAFLGFVFIKFNYKKIFYIIILITIIDFFFNGLFFSNKFLSLFSDSDLSFLSHDRVNSAAFYMMPLRVFEFTIGAILVFTTLNLNQKKYIFINQLSSFLGLGTIIWYIINLSSSDVFPYYNAFFVSLATALIILARNSLVNRMFFENNILGYIGKISYSLYLVHWPIIVFWYSKKNGELSIYDKFGEFVLSFLLAIVMHHFIEKRFRYEKYKKNDNVRFLRKRFVVTSIVLMGLFALFSLYGLKTKAHSDILNKESTIINNIVASESVLMKDAIAQIRQLTNDEPFLDPKKRHILIIGDSMGNDLNLALNNYPKISEKIETRILGLSHKCQFMLTDRTKINYYNKQSSLAELCEDTTEKHLNSGLIEQADVIIIAHNWYSFISDAGVEKAISRLKEKTSIPIYLIGKRIFMTKGVGESVSQVLYKHKKLNDFNEYLYTKYIIDEAIENRMKKIAYDMNIHYISMFEIQCDKLGKKCYGVDKNNNLLYRDAMHWTVNGSRFFIKRMLNNDDFRTTLFGNN